MKKRKTAKLPVCCEIMGMSKDRKSLLIYDNELQTLVQWQVSEGTYTILIGLDELQGVCLVGGI